MSKKGLRILVVLVGSIVVLPIGFYLQFRTLQMVGATNVMWLLFWTYVPVTLLVQVIVKTIEEDKNR